MGKLLEGKTAVITGGASGNGRAIAESFAHHGAGAVIVADLQEEPREGGTPTHDLIESKHASRARFVRCDISSLADLEGAIDAAEEFGGIDVMVNNAAVYNRQDFLEATEVEFDRVMSINVRGTYFGAQAAARRMVEKGRGVIINVGSNAGSRGAARFSLYCSSKGAIRAMTFALAAELGPKGVRVNIIQPGYIETAMTRQDVPISGTETSEQRVRATIPLRRPGQPEDVAGAAVFLASDLGAFVNAASLSVDGGSLNTAPIIE